MVATPLVQRRACQCTSEEEYQRDERTHDFEHLYETILLKGLRIEEDLATRRGNILYSKQAQKLFGIG